MPDLTPVGATSAPAPKSAKPNRKSRRRAASKKRSVTAAPLAVDEPMPMFVTFDRAAREIGCCKRHIYKLIKLGILKRVKFGKSARITRESIEAATK